MSTSTEITRLTDARNVIRDKLIDLGLTTSTAKLDALASSINGIANRGAVSATVQEGDTYTIPAGYHNGSGTVSGVSGGGNYNLQSKAITPTKSQQNVTPDNGYYGLSDVTVNAIPEAYQNVSSVTATASEVLANKVFVDATGSNVAGTMVNNGAVSKTLDATSTSYAVPTGYHNGGGLVKIALESVSATPSTSAQTIEATTGKVISVVNIDAIPANYKDTTSVDATASDVTYGKVFVNTTGQVTGTLPVIAAATNTLSTSSTSYTIPAGRHDGTGIVKVVLEEKSATPSTAVQSITPTSGKVLSKVTINAIPSKFGDTTGDTAVASYLLAGYKAHTISGGAATQITGTMNNIGAISATIDGLTTVSYALPTGYITGGSVSLTSDIETALAAI